MDKTDAFLLVLTIVLGFYLFAGRAPPDYNACVGTCGNGELECAEQCDDGNLRDGDGCSAACVREQNSGVVPEETLIPPVGWCPSEVTDHMVCAEPYDDGNALKDDRVGKLVRYVRWCHDPLATVVCMEGKNKLRVPERVLLMDVDETVVLETSDYQARAFE